MNIVWTTDTAADAEIGTYQWDYLDRDGKPLAHRFSLVPLHHTPLVHVYAATLHAGEQEGVARLVARCNDITEAKAWCVAFVKRNRTHMSRYYGDRRGQ